MCLACILKCGMSRTFGHDRYQSARLRVRCVCLLCLVQCGVIRKFGHDRYQSAKLLGCLLYLISWILVRRSRSRLRSIADRRVGVNRVETGNAHAFFFCFLVPIRQVCQS